MLPKPNNTNLNIALLPQGGKGWIAGVIYLQNVIRAVGHLPENERPELHILLSLEGDIQELKLPELNSNIPKLHYFAYREGITFKQKLKAWLHSFKKKQFPYSMEGLASMVNTAALFPLQTSLGKDFPLPWIGWIPDFQHKRLPQFFSQAEINNRDHTFQKLIDEATHVVVSSQDAYKDLMRWFPTQESKVSVFSFTCVASLQWYEDNPQKVVQHFSLPKKYLMFPSQFWRHKNHRLVFEALRLLKEQGKDDIALVLTGNQQDYRWPQHFNDLQEFIKHHNLSEQIYMLGLLERQQQIQLLRCAVAIIQPSLFEGWSSLVEDCRTLGKKIYLSDIPIHREQNPPDAQFFPPENAEVLAELINKDWPNLQPGPDIPKEQQAYIQQQERAKDYARLLIKIIKKL